MVTQQLDHLVLNLTKPGIRGMPRSLGPVSPSSDPTVGAVLYGTDDAREGIAVFVAKRKPRLGGH